MDNKAIKEIRLGDLMVSAGYITDDQLGEALALQKQDRSKRIGQILIEQGYISIWPIRLDQPYRYFHLSGG